MVDNLKTLGSASRPIRDIEKDFPDYLKWEQSTLLDAPSSMDLWAAGKFLGRECSTVNKNFLKCKMEKGEHPGVCIDHGDLVRVCTKNV